MISSSIKDLHYLKIVSRIQFHAISPHNINIVLFFFFRIHRSVINIFETKRKDVTKWLKNCEKKEREVDGDAQYLDSVLAALAKLKVR